MFKLAEIILRRSVARSGTECEAALYREIHRWNALQIRLTTSYCAIAEHRRPIAESKGVI